MDAQLAFDEVVEQPERRNQVALARPVRADEDVDVAKLHAGVADRFVAGNRDLPELVRHD